MSEYIKHAFLLIHIQPHTNLHPSQFTETTVSSNVLG